MGKQTNDRKRAMLPLQGIQVLDLSRVLSGPFCTMTLADLGAEVIKVEHPSGDETRHFAPLVEGESTYFLSLNRNKKSIVVNMKTDLGKQIIWDLVARSDIVVENFRPGILAKLGFSWDEIHQRSPRVILVSLSGYGQTGPLAEKAGYDIIAQGEGGLMETTGETDGPPVKAGFAVADIGTGMWAVIGALAALMSRANTDQGSHVDVSLLETMVSWQTYLVSAYLIVGHLPQRLGSSHQGIVPYQSFQASDGYFNLAVANDLLWAKFCDALDSIHAGEKWYRSVEYSTNNKRVQAREQLIGQLTPLFRSRPRCFWLDLFQQVGIPAGSIDSIAEVVHNPQVVARHLFEYVEHPTLGTIPTVRTPITFSDMSPVPPVAPPLLGADTAAVLQDLGYNDKAKKGDIL